MRALIVDDDAGMSGLYRRCFSLWGWDADESRRGSSARGFFSSRRYDAVLCDMDLPDGDGIVLAQVLRKLQPSVLVIITACDPRNLARAWRAGFTRCLRKPFDLAELKSLLTADSAKTEALDAPIDSCYSQRDERDRLLTKSPLCTPTGNAIT